MNTWRLADRKGALEIIFPLQQEGNQTNSKDLSFTNILYSENR